MDITVNGQQRTIATATSLADLLAAMNLNPQRVAVEHNGTILSQADFATTTLGDGDKLEIVSFVGGG